MYFRTNPFYSLLTSFFFIENSLIFVILDNDKLHVLKLYYLHFNKTNNKKTISRLLQL